ncbi:MAG: PAS domain-containing protein, partial [Candidatus Ranarchaeia archaeon]
MKARKHPKGLQYIAEQPFLEPIENPYLASFISSLPGSCIIFDSELDVVCANSSALDFIGSSEKEILGKNLIEITPQIKTHKRMQQFQKILSTGKSMIFEDVSYLDENRRIFLRAFKIGSGLGVLFEDVTEQKNIQESLRESEGKFRAISTSAKD